jgi:energy-coupling factor transporter ATP-binding protein EcfA2
MKIFSRHDNPIEEMWEQRLQEEQKLVSGLQETPNTITLVYGPRGSGKSDLINKVQNQVKYHLKIDCDELINVPDHEMLSRFSKQIGFYPQLNFLVASSGVIDSVIAATTGAKANLTTTSEAQLRKILETLTMTLTKVSYDQSRKNPVRNEDDMQEEQSSDIQYPVIFVEGYMSKDRAKNDFIYEILAHWSANVEENRLAHVVFVSSNPGAIKNLSKGIYTVSVNISDAEQAS